VYFIIHSRPEVASVYFIFIALAEHKSHCAIYRQFSDVLHKTAAPIDNARARF
jgi:hypothetical protein